jgi:hypothetical protein
MEAGQRVRVTDKSALVRNELGTVTRVTLTTGSPVLLDTDPSPMAFDPECVRAL